jgi:menaquinone-dependent protoporphyrinogen oxidase
MVACVLPSSARSVTSSAQRHEHSGKVLVDTVCAACHAGGGIALASESRGLSMTHIFIVYSTTDGHTRKICERLRALIEAQGEKVSLVSIGEARAVDLSAFDKIVVGASIRYGKHNPLVREFVNANARVLDSKPNAFFSVNIVARKADKNRPETNPYLQKFLRQSHWRPKELEVFAGKVDFPR